jgi:hypothetical protein
LSPKLKRLPQTLQILPSGPPVPRLIGEHSGLTRNWKRFARAHDHFRRNSAAASWSHGHGRGRAWLSLLPDRRRWARRAALRLVPVKGDPRSLPSPFPPSGRPVSRLTMPIRVQCHRPFHGCGQRWAGGLPSGCAQRPHRERRACCASPHEGSALLVQFMPVSADTKCDI